MFTYALMHEFAFHPIIGIDLIYFDELLPLLYNLVEQYINKEFQFPKVVLLLLHKLGKMELP